MKKLILLALTIVIMAGCSRGMNYRIPFQENNKRIAVTKDHIIIETCTGFNDFGKPLWVFENILQNDTVGIKEIERLIGKIKEQ